MSLRDRFSAALSGAAARAERLAQTLRPHETNVAKGIPATTTRTTPYVGDPRVAAALGSWEALSSRILPLAGPTKTRAEYYETGDDLTPEKIIAAQRNAIRSGLPFQWINLVDQAINRDGHLESCIMQRIADVAKGEWVLHPASVGLKVSASATMRRAGLEPESDPTADDPAAVAIASFVTHAYRSTSGWSDAIKWLLRSNAYGYSASELQWAETIHDFPGARGERIRCRGVGLAALHMAHPKHFRFNYDTDDVRLWLGSSDQAIPFGQIALMRGIRADPITIKRSYMQQGIWYSAMRQMALSLWANYSDRYALPFPVLQYDGTLAQYPEYRAAFEDISVRMGRGKGIYYPRENMQLEIKDPARGGEAGGPYASFWGALNDATTILVQGHALVNSVGGPHGSYAQANVAVDRASILAELDAVDLWETIDQQIGRPLLAFNSYALADALRAAGYDVTPEDVERLWPRGAHHVPGKSDPEKELALAERASKIGLKVSASATMRRAGLEVARSKDDVIRGEAEQVSAGAASVGAVEAAQGVQVPNDASGAGGGDDVAKPQPDNITMAIALTAMRHDPATSHRVSDAWYRWAGAVLGSSERFDWKEADHPRASDGKFGPGGGGGGRNEEEKPAEEIAAAKQHHAEQRAQKAAERQARAEARQQKAEQLAAKKIETERVKAERAAARQERAKVRAERQQAMQEKSAAKKAKLEQASKAAREVGAPVTRSGKVDAAKVPGARRDFKPLTSVDPANGYKGRSYEARNWKEQLDEFLRAPATGGYGINDALVEGALGKGRNGEGGGTWDAVKEKYGVKVDNFEDAFKAVVGATVGGAKRDWRNFDIETLRECDGEPFRNLQLPAWIYEAQAHQDEVRGWADAYDDPEVGDAWERDTYRSAGAGYALADVPF